MRVVIIGSGGREHALCWALKKSKNISKIYCIPGNAGTSAISENVELNINDFNELTKFVINKKVDTVIVGPEKPLVDGIVDFLSKKKINVFGPNKIASKLEGSKIFMKELCKKYNIPTAKFGIFKNFDNAKIFLKECSYPIVVKADGLAAGKGVYICENKDKSISAVKEIFDGKFGEAENVLIEEFLEGEEMSFFIISDGNSYKKFGTAQDHKRVLEGDEGKNTGGMGAYCPSRLESEQLDEKILKKIIEPTIKGLKELNTSFCGFLYAGLMIVKGEPFLIEYNVRMGDPECQTILPRLKTDFGLIIDSCIKRKLHVLKLEWDNQKSLSIVLCSKGYPEDYKKNIQIKNLEKIILGDNEYIFHAGTKKSNSFILSDGGRVLNFVIKSNDFKSGRDKIIKLIDQLNWEDGFYRKDIGYKVIN
mgnify:CR=1 FL=1|tara:strand:+ start:1858 stop:3120 length:1263 start_codon:yes stop_codon:yes gene_type:complete